MTEHYKLQLIAAFRTGLGDGGAAVSMTTLGFRHRSDAEAAYQQLKREPLRDNLTLNVIKLYPERDDK